MATPKNTPIIHNSDPKGRKFNNVPPEYFGKRANTRTSTSMAGLRPSFFAMLRGEQSPPPKGK